MKTKKIKNLLNWSMALVAAAMLFTSCGDDPDPKPELIEDGMYVKGAATALTNYDPKGLMSVTNNENGQVERAELLELFVPVKAEVTGFSIIEVVGGVPKIYGPGDDFALVAVDDRSNDEPKDGDIFRGSYQESATPFTVETEGLYHVVIDKEREVVVVAEVKWGVIGGATPLGWGGSTELTASAFDLNNMTYSVNDFELRGGDWKFRYSNGWKIEIDTVGSDDVLVNTNLGGAVENLAPGGDNIVNDAPGVYTIELAYALDGGYTATATKTGDLPLTNWEGVTCDAVGTGVSSDNATAIADPSGWGWGNKLLADNSGAPVKDGDVYTWTWTNVTLEANEGFKIRTEDGVAPANGNGANFDAGLEVVDHSSSSANVDPATSGNLTVTVKAAYDITLTIDAADSDAKTIVIADAAGK